MNAYTLKNLEKRKGGFRFRAEDIKLPGGRIYAVLGANGSGKTTLLNLLSFLEQPSEGNLQYAGKRFDYNNQSALLKARRTLAYQMQNPYLFSMSVRDNISCGLKLRRAPGKAVKRRVDDVMSRLALTSLASRNVRSLSGGEAQRVALARTLALEADVYLFDEPTANVDRENIRAAEEEILNLNRGKNATVILTTHSRDQAYRMSQHVYSIINGQVRETDYVNLFSGTLKERSDGLKEIDLTGEVKLVVNKGKPGKATVSVSPRDIILSHERFESSALNNIRGVINKIEEVNGSLRIYIDAGVVFCVLITHRSFHDMGLNIGKKLWLTFKANSVKVFPNAV